MATKCNFCAGTGNRGGGEKDKACPKCKGTGEIADPGATPARPADVSGPITSPRSRGRGSRAH